MKLRYVLAAAALLFSVMPLAAQPLACQLGWSQYSDVFVVCTPTGQLSDWMGTTDVNEDPAAIYTLATPPDPGQFGNATTFCELTTSCGPGLPQLRYSDIFGVATVDGTLYLAFSSDGEGTGTPYGGQGTIYVPEPNGWYNATMYLDPTLQSIGYTAWFTSDPVPEPTTLLLIGSGIGLLATRLRKR